MKNASVQIVDKCLMNIFEDDNLKIKCVRVLRKIILITIKKVLYAARSKTKNQKAVSRLKILLWKWKLSSWRSMGVKLIITILLIRNHRNPT